MSTATVAVIVSGVVGVGGLSVPVVLDRLAASRRREEARDARLDELRTVIDDAAVALMRVWDAMPQIEEVKAGHGEIAAVVPRLRNTLYEVWRQEARLSARLGNTDKIVLSYHHAHEVVGGIHTFWSNALSGDPDPGELFDSDEVRTAFGQFFHYTAERTGPYRRLAGGRGPTRWTGSANRSVCGRRRKSRGSQQDSRGRVRPELDRNAVRRDAAFRVPLRLRSAVAVGGRPRDDAGLLRLRGRGLRVRPGHAAPRGPLNRPTAARLPVF